MVAVSHRSESDVLAEATVFATDGARVPIGSLFGDHPVVLVFVRHFGCLFCKEQVADLRARSADFAARGAEIVVIGNGTIEDARGFAAEHAPGMRVLTDPTKEAYCAVGMQRGLKTSMSFGVVARAARAMARGHRQTQTQGDPYQQGGVIVVGADRQVRYRFVSDEAGQHPAIDDVLAAVPIARAG